MERKTIFSADRKYRYTLWREFYSVRAANPPLIPVEGNQAHNYVQFIGLNPSTADETNDDPTIRRCIGYAKAWGYGALCMTNLFAFRATDPRDMYAADEPIGLENNTRLLEIGNGAGLIIAAWGNHGAHLDRQDWVKKMFFDCKLKLHALQITRSGAPSHPLYLPKNLQPIPYE